MPVTPVAQQPGRRGLGGLERVQRTHDVARGQRDALARRDEPGGVELAVGGHVVGRAQQQADACVAERDRWPIACSTATASSHETHGKPRPSMARVDQHGRQLALAQPARSGRGARRAGRRARPRTRRPTPGAGAAARCSPPRSRHRRSGCTAAACIPAGPGRRRRPRRTPGRWGSGSSGRTRPTSRARSPRSLDGRS